MLSSSWRQSSRPTVGHVMEVRVSNLARRDGDAVGSSIEAVTPYPTTYDDKCCQKARFLGVGSSELRRSLRRSRLQ